MGAGETIEEGGAGARIEGVDAGGGIEEVGAGWITMTKEVGAASDPIL